MNENKKCLNNFALLKITNDSDRSKKLIQNNDIKIDLNSILPEKFLKIPDSFD